MPAVLPLTQIRYRTTGSEIGIHYARFSPKTRLYRVIPGAGRGGGDTRYLQPPGEDLFGRLIALHIGSIISFVTLIVPTMKMNLF
ncbi:hypothetical protein scyTo_0012260 [Scyliorhinus torazame]|uniref:Uncharacterized protein n=1 Tax=Scyliorhinus torazame TaxID=75743 RepID=A0A401P588_SCYTO|nr:hypothetical protein [Scyliorhinus torazame]